MSIVEKRQIALFGCNNDPAILAGSLFFIGIICLLSYLSQTFHSLSFLSFLICCSSFLFIALIYKRTIRSFILLIICILGIIFGIKVPFVLVVISTIFYFYFSKKSKSETVLWKASCSLPALIIVINIVGYWGIPGSVVHIWFWSLPIICALILFYWFFHGQKYIVFSIFLTCSGGIIANELGLIYSDTECVGVISDKRNDAIDGVSLCLLKNITNDSSLLFLPDACQKISTETVKKKWIISLVSTPSLRPEWLLKNARAGEYYVFAEHDNMTAFIGSDSPFNSDSFRRKSPWNVYKPIMNPSLFKASEKDVLYCSNIGCTIKKDLWGYPLVWTYTKLGTPILLAKGIFNKGRRLVYVGDSDPMGDFLAPYNPFWIRALLGVPNYFEIANAVLMLLLGFYTIKRIAEQTKWSSCILPFLILSFCMVDKFQSDIKPVVDVSISATDNWLSPHYSSNFSSMPKKLAQENLIVAVERKETISKLDIKIVNKKKYKINKIDSSSQCNMRLLILLPGASMITSSGNILIADDVPLGKKTIELQLQKEIVVDDARNLFLDGNLISEMYFVYNNNTYVIATGSPQKIEGIHDLLYKK